MTQDSDSSKTLPPSEFSKEAAIARELEEARLFMEAKRKKRKARKRPYRRPAWRGSRWRPQLTTVQRCVLVFEQVRREFAVLSWQNRRMTLILRHLHRGRKDRAYEMVVELASQLGLPPIKQRGQKVYNYSAPFKLTAIRYARTMNNKAAACRKFGISTTALNAWLKAYDAGESLERSSNKDPYQQHYPWVSYTGEDADAVTPEQIQEMHDLCNGTEKPHELKKLLWTDKLIDTEDLEELDQSPLVDEKQVVSTDTGDEWEDGF